MREIINKRFTTTIAIAITTGTIILSKRIRRICTADDGILPALFLLTFLIAAPDTLKAQADGDIIPRVNTSLKRYGRDPEPPFLGYIENPWSRSSPVLHNDEQTDFLWQTENGPTTRNDTDTKPKDTAAIRRGVQRSSLKRSKRGVVHLYNIIWCATGCNPLAYKGYGCYCGFLGSGFTIDGIDRCCKMHDWCYEATDCPMFLEYFVPYYWKCYRGNKPICAVEHGDLGGSGSCAQRLCECDRAFAECLRRYPCPTTKAMCTSSPWRLVQNLFMLL